MSNLRSDQNKSNRNIFDYQEPRSYDEKSTEEIAGAFLRERERIRREREQELEDERDLRRDAGLNPDNLRESLAERITDAIVNKLPSGLSLPIEVIRWSEDNQLKVQSLLLGLPDDLELPVDEIPVPQPTFAPIVPPASSWNLPVNISTWEDLVNPLNFNKLLTFTASYTGWLEYLEYNAPGSGQTVQLVANNPLTPPGIIINSIRTFRPANPLPNEVGRIGTRTVKTHRGFQRGHLIDIPSQTNGDRFNVPDRSAENLGNPSGFARYNYHPIAQYLGSTNFNTPQGIRRFHSVKMNLRWDIAVNNVIDAWYAGYYGANYPNFRILAFFQGALPYTHYDPENPLITPVEIDGDPIKEIPPEPITPPPPPPKGKCDCMSCCKDTTQSQELTNRLLRQILKNIGEPREVSLWDTDFTKPGVQTEKKKPGNAFEHLALLSDRLEIALKVLGIDVLPITVDTSRSKYDNLGNLFLSSPLEAMRELGKNMLGTDRKQISSVLGFLDWIGDTIDEKLGHWESEVTFKDVELLKDNDQELKLVHGNIQHALHDVTKFAGNAGIHSEANTWLISDVLMELAVLKKEIVGQSFAMQLLIDYLGFDHKEESVKIPIPVTFDPELLKNRNLSKFLEDSEVPIVKQTLKDKELSLSQRLTEIESTLGILRAAHQFPVRNVGDVMELLRLLGAGKDDWKQFLEDMNKFAEDNELQVEIEDIENDD